MGYESDQFYGLDTIESGEYNASIGIGAEEGLLGTTYVVDVANKAFSYPDNIVRGGYRAKRQVWNEGTGGYDPAPGENFDLGVLKKGYIRSLKLDDAQSVVKCQFQFNPATLNQSVSQNTQVLNFLQQNMSQYAQPMPSNVNFSFELFFDRSYELNHFKGAVEKGKASGALWAKTDPSVVGVLHDVGTLYEVVGVGLSASQQDYMQSTLEETIRAELLTASEEGDDTLSTVDDVNEAIAERSAQASALLGVNQGNTAFLLPIPVRAVFSSLYIVEGLVQNISVRYLKFTRNLVPMQASATITLEGKYIGFAKKNTFFTHVLEERRKLRAEQIAELNTAGQKNEDLKEIGKNDFSEISVQIKEDTGGEDLTDLMPSTGDVIGEIEAQIRLFPYKQKMYQTRDYWGNGNELTVSFSGTAKTYMVMLKGIQQNQVGYDLLEKIEESYESVVPNDTQDAKDKRLDAVSAFTEHVQIIADEYESRKKNLTTTPSERRTALYTDKGYAQVTDEGAYIQSAILVRTDAMTSEESKTSFSSYDDIREKLDDVNDWVGNDQRGPRGGHDPFVHLVSEPDGQDIEDAEDSLNGSPFRKPEPNIRFLIVYDFTIKLTSPEGSATGYAKDYRYEKSHYSAFGSWLDFDTKKDITVDWGD